MSYMAIWRVKNETTKMIFDHYEMKILKIKSSLIEELNTLAIF
jgi:hypothetical protein